jgi:hypothetical protein
MLDDMSIGTAEVRVACGDYVVLVTAIAATSVDESDCRRKRKALSSKIWSPEWSSTTCAHREEFAGTTRVTQSIEDMKTWTTKQRMSDTSQPQINLKRSQSS